MKYCPNCGAEYRSGDECWECQVALVDHPPEPVSQPESQPVSRDRVVVFRSGRRMDAELVRGRLEADGLEASIWSGGLGPWRMESALTEVTGVANDFNSHRVVVDAGDAERAREVLDEPASTAEGGDDLDPSDYPESAGGFLASLRQRWILLAFAVFMLLVVIFAGPIGN